MANRAVTSVPSTKPLVITALTATVLILGLGSWIYFSGSRFLSVQAKEHGRLIFAEGAEAARSSLTNQASAGDAGNEKLLAKAFAQVDAWAKSITLATAASGAGLMLSLAFGVGWWRQSWRRRVSRRNQEVQNNAIRLEQTTKELHRELKREADRRQSAESELARLQADQEEIVRQRIADLTQSYAALEKELNDRKAAEKNLTYQRQELVRSKDVLELHVHARNQELQKLQRRYEHILNSAGEGIYGLDLQGRTTFINPTAAKLTGWQVEEMTGKTENEVFHHQLTDRIASDNAEMRDGKGNLPSERTFFRKDGSSFPVEYTRTPIMENGRMVGAVVLFKDITERKRADESLARKAAELARSNAELEQFAYVASHDLQEPLRKIQAFGGRLKTKLDCGKYEEGSDYLERMQNASARMQILINDLLTFSRVISSNQPFVPVDLAVITREVMGDLEVRIERSKARIETENLPVLDADPLQMRQLLQNLISNSLKFQPSGQEPEVKISAQILKRPFSCAKHPTPDDEVCELKVADNGIGIEEQYIEKIFAVFQRLHGRSEYEGTGVGLAVCRRIAERHGGTICAEGQLGKGTTFTVTLPVRQPPAESAA